MVRDTFEAPEFIKRWKTLALGVGGILSLFYWGIALAMGGTNIEDALRGWLLGFIFWAGIALGGLGILLLQYLTGGAWGVVIRRIAEACSRTVWFLPVLFIPIAVGVYNLYEFAHLVGHDEIIDRRIVGPEGFSINYYNPTFWGIRTLIYFFLFGLIAYLLNNWSAKQDKSESYEEAAYYLGQPTAFSGPTMVFFVIIVTLAGVDWMMSLEPHWFSTIWGLLFAAGWALSCFCFAVALMAYMADKAPMDRVLGKRHFHDIGKLMLALVMVWAYFNFSQYLIIWSGNLTEETPYFLVRSKGGWGVMGLLLIIFHFAFPFLILLQQDFKRKAKWLATLAIFILFMRLVDMYYIIGPSPRIGELKLHLLEVPFRITPWDFVAPVAVGGLWLAWFFWQFASRPIVPAKDPFFENAIKHGRGH